MLARPTATVRSPRPDEPDVHVRVTYADTAFDYIACKTAARNFLCRWQRSHHPGATATEVRDHATTLQRLPYEELWLTP
ncbi:hypothetical protein [Nocardia sp. BMG51109]|uniref:hypothetical protein n=1 Tax=Nocardia sp. BMG51109 TaxID=1056816 RepID=UPI00046324BF|nr:hypothetical protein [Nocardia sp. BMG51109]